MSHLDDLKRQYSHTAVEITRLAHEYAAVDPNSSQAQAILRQFRPVADKFDVLIEAVDTEQKRLAANAQQPRPMMTTFIEVRCSKKMQDGESNLTSSFTGTSQG